jgi:hypothetical protein
VATSRQSGPPSGVHRGYGGSPTRSVALGRVRAAGDGSRLALSRRRLSWATSHRVFASASRRTCQSGPRSGWGSSVQHPVGGDNDRAPDGHLGPFSARRFVSRACCTPHTSSLHAPIDPADATSMWLSHPLEGDFQQVLALGLKQVTSPAGTALLSRRVGPRPTRRARQLRARHNRSARREYRDLHCWRGPSESRATRTSPDSNASE